MNHLSDIDQSPYTAPDNNGGAAFPGGQYEPPHAGSNDREPWNHGMTLRDYAAVKAMAAIIVADGIQYVESNAKKHAELALLCADNFIAAREVRK